MLSKTHRENSRADPLYLRHAGDPLWPQLDGLEGRIIFGTSSCHASHLLYIIPMQGTAHSSSTPQGPSQRGYLPPPHLSTRTRAGLVVLERPQNYQHLCVSAKGSWREDEGHATVLWIRNDLVREFRIWILPSKLNNWYMVSVHNGTNAGLCNHFRGCLRKYVCIQRRILKYWRKVQKIIQIFLSEGQIRVRIHNMACRLLRRMCNCHPIKQ